MQRRAVAARGNWVDGSTLSSAPDFGKLTFFTHLGCPYAHRVHLTLLEKEVDFQLVHVDLSDKPHWFRGLGSGGLVPLVQHDGTFHRESLDICRWLNEEFDGPPLLPDDPKRRQAALQLVTSGANRFASAGLSFLAGKHGRSWGISHGHSNAQRDAFDAQVAELTRLLRSSGGPFLLGSAISLVDLAYLPFAERFEIGLRDFCDYDMSSAHGGAVGRWLEAARERRYASGSPSPDRELFSEALRRHQSLDFFDYVTYGPYDLHPHAA